MTVAATGELSIGTSAGKTNKGLLHKGNYMFMCERCDKEISCEATFVVC